MNKRGLSIGITVLVIVGILAMIKFVPFWVSLVNLGVFIVGFLAGYLFKKKEIITVEKVVEKIVEIPAKKSSKKKQVVS